MIHYPRKILPALKKHLARKQITVLTGMRRTGKTTLVHALLDSISSPNKIYIDLELLSNQDLFSVRNYDAIINALEQRGLSFDRKATIAIDEIQLVKNLPSVLKYLYDNYDIKFIVTGSSSFYMKNVFTESLAGRKFLFELFPLDFGEFLTFKEIPFASKNNSKQKFDAVEYERLSSVYEEFIEYGGFPEVVLAKTVQEKKERLDDIISSYVNVDVASMSDFQNRQRLYQIIKLLASRVGSKLDYSKISRLVGVTRSTVQNYMNLFADTYLLFRLPVHTNNADREIVKAQKLYFCDNGLLSILADVGSGIKFENAVFNQLRHQGELRYYALKTGHEIDFILDGKIAYEAKETPTTTDLKQLRALSAKAEVKQHRIIGRHASKTFDRYVWGGEFR